MTKCAMCRRQILAGQASILTTDDQTIHLDCAEQDARAAAQKRDALAQITALIGPVIMLTLALVGLDPAWLQVAIFAAWLLAHVIINRRWWQLRAQRWPVVGPYVIKFVSKLN